MDGKFCRDSLTLVGHEYSFLDGYLLSPLAMKFRVPSKFNLLHAGLHRGTYISEAAPGGD